jgi:hypothetical protein
MVEGEIATDTKEVSRGLVKFEVVEEKIVTATKRASCGTNC